MDDLPPGTELMRGQYTIESYLNSGGFGITYCARDSLGRTVVIKECFPSVLCRRVGTSIEPSKIDYAVELSKLIEQFVSEAHALAALNHKNILHVHQVFEENQTAYMAIDFIDGPDLMDVIQNTPERLTSEEILRITRRALGAIKYIHSEGMLHRDISPDNILIDETGEPVLIDFGAALRSTKVPGRVFSKVKFVKDGYSPQEFYIEGAEQGEWSDIYGFAATIYHLISGAPPVDGQQRMSSVAQGHDDPYVKLAGTTDDYPGGFLEALDKALAIMPVDRLQTADEWLELIPARPARVLSRREPFVSRRTRPVSTATTKTRHLGADLAPLDIIKEISKPATTATFKSSQAPIAADELPNDDDDFALSLELEDGDYDVDETEPDDEPVDIQAFVPVIGAKVEASVAERSREVGTDEEVFGDPSESADHEPLDPLEDAIAETAKRPEPELENVIARALNEAREMAAYDAASEDAIEASEQSIAAATEVATPDIANNTPEDAASPEVAVRDAKTPGKLRGGLWASGAIAATLALLAGFGAIHLMGEADAPQATASTDASTIDTLPAAPFEPSIAAPLDRTSTDAAAPDAAQARDAAIAAAVAEAERDAAEAQRQADAQAQVLAAANARSEAMARAIADTEARIAAERAAFLAAVEASATPVVASSFLDPAQPVAQSGVTETTPGVLKTVEPLKFDTLIAPGIENAQPTVGGAAARPLVRTTDAKLIALTSLPTNAPKAATPSTQTDDPSIRVAAVSGPAMANVEARPQVDIVAPAALPKPPLLTRQITSAHWDVEMPFGSELELIRNANTIRLTEITDPTAALNSGPWVREGTVIYAMNGERLKPGVALPTQLLDALVVDPDGYTRASVRYRDGATGRIDRGLLTIPVHRTLRLADQTLLAYRVVAGAWVVQVEQPGNLREDGLRTGDILVREINTNINITNQDALGAVFDQLVAAEIGTARFIVNRGGTEIEARSNLAREPFR